MTFTTDWAPLPCLPFDVPVYLFYTDPALGPVFLYDDTGVDYAALLAEHDLLNSMASGAGAYGPSPRYGSNDFYLTILLDTNSPGYVDLILHNTTTDLYQLLSKPVITEPTWTFGQILPGDAATNNVWFGQLPDQSPPNQFFRAVSGVTRVSVKVDDYLHGPIIEPASTNQITTPGVFNLTVNPPVGTDLTIVYQLSGSAKINQDYTNIPTRVTLLAGETQTNIYIQAKYDPNLDFDENVIITLVLTNGYLVDPNHYSAELTISDNLTNIFQTVISGLPAADLDYHEPTKSLLISATQPWALSNFFARAFLNIITNSGIVSTNLVLTNWSGQGGLVNEIKIGAVRASDFGFPVGEMFFTPTDPGPVGLVSADGTGWTNDWVTLGESNLLRGGLYVDQTGIWGGDLIAVTGDDDTLPLGMNVWRVNAQTNASLVVNIPYSQHLEGILTLSNNPAQYGPLAGKLIVGDEIAQAIYAIDTNGVVVPYDLSRFKIAPSDIDLIVSNQDLYCSDPQPYVQGGGIILKIPRTFFTNYIGDLLVTQAGEVHDRPAGLFILRWDNATTNFVTRSVPYDGEYFEHTTFAPIDIPLLQTP